MKILQIMSTIMLTSTVVYLLMWPRAYISSLCFEYWSDGLEDKLMTLVGWVLLVGAVSFPVWFTS